MAKSFRPNFIPPDLIGPDVLAPLVRLSPASIRSDVSRRPWRLPPRFQLAGSNRLWWSRATVDKWLREQSRVIVS
jgi:hypothetical protein